MAHPSGLHLHGGIPRRDGRDEDIPQWLRMDRVAARTELHPHLPLSPFFLLSSSLFSGLLQALSLALVSSLLPSTATVGERDIVFKCIR